MAQSTQIAHLVINADDWPAAARRIRNICQQTYPACGYQIIDSTMMSRDPDKPGGLWQFVVRLQVTVDI